MSNRERNNRYYPDDDGMDEMPDGGAGMQGYYGVRGFGSQGSFQAGDSQRNYGNYGRNYDYGTRGNRTIRRRQSNADYDRIYEYGNTNFGGAAGLYGTHRDRAAGVDSPEMRRGQHSGRGPKDYQRPDESIRDDVCEILTDHGDIDATNMQIDVINGEVTLRGTVQSRQMKRLAEDALNDVNGIKDIHNRLRVEERGEQSI